MGTQKNSCFEDSFRRISETEDSGSLLHPLCFCTGCVPTALLLPLFVLVQVVICNNAATSSCDLPGTEILDFPCIFYLRGLFFLPFNWSAVIYFNFSVFFHWKQGVTVCLTRSINNSKFSEDSLRCWMTDNFRNNSAPIKLVFLLLAKVLS